MAFVRTCCAWSSGDFMASGCDRIKLRSFLCLIRRSYQSQGMLQAGAGNGAPARVRARLSRPSPWVTFCLQFGETQPMTTEVPCALSSWTGREVSPQMGGLYPLVGGIRRAEWKGWAHVPVHQLLGSRHVTR